MITRLTKEIMGRFIDNHNNHELRPNVEFDYIYSDVIIDKRKKKVLNIARQVISMSLNLM